MCDQAIKFLICSCFCSILFTNEMNKEDTKNVTSPPTSPLFDEQTELGNNANKNNGLGSYWIFYNG